MAIPIVGDVDGEPSEQLYVDFSGVVNGLPGSARATVTILNDDSSSQVTTSTADFSAGTLGAGAYLSETANGELMLAPRGSEFSGTSLPADWTLTPLASVGASATVGGGRLSISGAGLTAPFEPLPGQTLEFVASFTRSPKQAIGLGKSTTLGSPMAMFVIGADGELHARTINGTRFLEQAFAGIDWLGKPHRYQIVWTAATVSYYIDGTLIDPHGSMAFGTTAMRPVVRRHDRRRRRARRRLDPDDTVLGLGHVHLRGVRWRAIRVLWQKLTTTNSVPSGTSMVVTYRRGDTPVPDASWAAFATVPGNGTIQRVVALRAVRDSDQLVVHREVAGGPGRDGHLQAVDRRPSGSGR